MDERVRALRHDFPSIFERNRGLPDFEDDWVVIDVANGGSSSGEGLDFDDEFLEDLGRYDGDAETLFEDPTGFDDPTGLPPPLLDIRLPTGANVNLGELSEALTWSRPGVIDRVRRKIRGTFPGGPAGFGTRGIVPPPDALAVYLPFHRYPDLWGIYLLDGGVASLAQDLQAITRLLGYSLGPLESRRAAVTYLFHHEAYHSAVESFALRSELPLRKPVYKRALRDLYTRQWTHDEPHEETLATAYGIRKVRSNLRLPGPLLEAVILALRIYMACCPPPYSAGDAYLDDEPFNDLERRFMEAAIRNSTTRALPASAWTMGTYLMAPLLQRNRRYSWICDREDFRRRSRLAVHYFRRRDVISCLERVAGAVTKAGGSHLHIVRTFSDPDGRPTSRRTQIPSGEVHRGTLAGMLKDLELSLNVEAFRAKCREVGEALS